MCISTRWASAAMLFASCASCTRQPEIDTYRVERVGGPKPRREAPEAFAKRLDHMLVAVFPREKDAVFFKLTGKAGAVERQREEFTAFAASVEPAGPAWELPEGWSETKSSGLRLATLSVPDAEGPLDCSVTVLPMAGDWDDYLESNIVRWMRQLGLTSEFTPPPPRDTMLGFAKTLPGSSGRIIELRGILNQASLPQQPTAQAARSPSQPQTSQRSTQATPSEIQFTKPESWQPGRMSPARKAAFRIPGDSGDGEVTVTVFPAAPGSPMADVDGNVARWRGQLGEAAGSVEPKITEQEVSGFDASLIELVGPADDPNARAMRIAMVPVAGRVWFIKLAGTRSVVAAEEANFRAFLESLEL